mgnify:CR=1 FL=1|jgi:hypothetical protein|tara:strand:- start:499 stop:762 length:264 start_codon:yes stop_codon:yes gene_type:complete
MATYPQFTVYRNIKDINEMYEEIASWSNRLTALLQTRDDIELIRPASTVISVVTVTELASPNAGDIAFSIGESKFKGYTGNAWVDFH